MTIKDNIFMKTDHDEKIAPSVEDKIFLNLMGRDFRRNSDGHWEAPPPFRNQTQLLHVPNNRSQAVTRALSLDRSLKHNPVKKEHVFTFMDKIFERGHAEEAPPIPDTKEQWYIPICLAYTIHKKETQYAWYLTPQQSSTIHLSTKSFLKVQTLLIIYRVSYYVIV
jgi:hypothetical protein